MSNYSATSHLAGEFIHDGEIRATLEYASEHREDMTLIEEILNKADLDLLLVAELFNIVFNRVHTADEV